MQHYPQQNQQYDQSYNNSQQTYNAANFQKNDYEDKTNSKQTPTDSGTIQVQVNNSHELIIEGGQARHNTQITLFKLKNILKKP